MQTIFMGWQEPRRDPKTFHQQDEIEREISREHVKEGEEKAREHQKEGLEKRTIPSEEGITGPSDSK